jgi:phage-related protein (TIGR01555 family)
MSGDSKALVKKIGERIDSFYNLITGLGGSRDKTTGWQYQRDVLLPLETLDAMFHSNDLARKIVSWLPEEAMRHGFELCNGDDEADAKSSSNEEARIWDVLNLWGIPQKAPQAMTWGRLFGAGGMLLGGPGDPTIPLRDETVKALAFVDVIDRRDIAPRTFYSDPMKPKFAEVETWWYRPYINGTLMPAGAERVVHESRIVMFKGVLTSRRTKQLNQGFDMSSLDPVYQTLMQVNANWQGVSHLMQDISQGVFAIKGLMEMIAAGQEDIVRKRMELVDMARSVARSVLLDADGETFDRKGTPLAGVPEIVNAGWQRLAAAADMSVTRLMGMSPAGLNATGESDIRKDYDRVRSYQEQQAKPALDRVVRLAAQVAGVADPTAWGCEFPSLWQMSPKEQAELAKIVADTDKVRIDSGQVLPEEAAITRSTEDGEYSIGFPKIDLDVRKAMLSKELVLVEKEAGKPEPPPVVTAPGEPAPPEPVEQKDSRADEIGKVAHALKELREAGVVVDEDKLKEQFPGLPVKAIVDDE